MSVKVFLLYTGGTFGMRPAKDRDGLVPSHWDSILPYLPSTQNEDFFHNFNGVSFTYANLEPAVDSSNITPETWDEIAGQIAENYEEHDGFVIIHGTDTMAYTASALSFMLEGLSKPVVLTGSQLPVFHPRTDAIVNLSNAIYIAAYQNFMLPCIPEVCVCFNDDILRGNRTVKSSTNDFEGFKSPNFDQLGWLEQKIEVNSKVLNAPGNSLIIRNRFSNKVVNVTLFPGYDPGALIELVKSGKLEGIVLKTFGSGNIPDNPVWLELVKACEEKQVLILATTQCPNGSIHLGKYDAGKVLLSDVVVNGYDLTSEAALTKLMWVIGNFEGPERKQMLGSSIRGEMTID